ncbi:hypothetical protein GCM10009530_13540 [Microbispora corallina]|uniref:SH3b domain-containing protein n=1 Tax=Microbispora corallina TaxID=83302 RepID=A0ABQ4FT29_9ACTN|nr:hypothetical protein [Microbispora corallina]GIH37949.1 hypothetical protein Mco01_09490 [Microbispora corallina]
MRRVFAVQAPVTVALAAVLCLPVAADAAARGAGADRTAHAGTAAAARTKLFVVYGARGACTVHFNYPRPGVVANGTFTIPAGRHLIWRYNVDSDWALVSDPSRADRTFPWWGFTRRDCIGRSVKQKGYPAGVPVPRRIQEGRSNVSPTGWRAVGFALPAAPIVERRRKVTRNATLRDEANFVIGNVPAGWHVHLTRTSRSNGHWVYVFVPNAQRWGYMERTAL